MQVNIINLWYSMYNYGASLTGYALQKVLQKYCKNTLINTGLRNFHKHESKSFYEFKYNNLEYTEYVSNSIDYEKLNDNANIFITGSDQVFRPKYAFMERQFSQFLLDFVRPENKKIAFSASFGVDKEQFLKENSPETIKHMQDSLKTFDFISVREKSGVEICKDVFGVDAEWVIDPVFILEKENYYNLIENSNINYKNKIVAYVLDSDREYNKAYKYLSKKHNKKVVKTANSDISIENWLASIRDCDLFVTDSFHGMCFALIFNKPFICLANKERGGSRFTSICEMLDVENQCIDCAADIMEKDCVFKVDYQKVNINIEK